MKKIVVYFFFFVTLLSLTPLLLGYFFKFDGLGVFNFIIALTAYTAVFKILYDYFISKPDIVGRIFPGIIGHAKINEKDVTTYLVYIYLTNKGKNAVHIFDYEMEIFIENRWKRLKRWYGMNNISTFTFSDEFGKEIVMPNFLQKLIANVAKPVEFGIPLHGFVLFVDDNPEKTTREIGKYKVTFIDAFDNRHIIESNSLNLGNIYLLQDMAGISLPSNMIR